MLLRPIKGFKDGETPGIFRRSDVNRTQVAVEGWVGSSGGDFRDATRDSGLHADPVSTNTLEGLGAVVRHGFVHMFATLYVSGFPPFDPSTGSVLGQTAIDINDSIRA
jgi:hypothetical protein